MARATLVRGGTCRRANSAERQRETYPTRLPDRAAVMEPQAAGAQGWTETAKRAPLSEIPTREQAEAETETEVNSLEINLACWDRSRCAGG